MRINQFFSCIPGIIILFSFLGAFSQKEGEWPCFHGIDRTNKSQEVGLLKEWSAGGPRLKWVASGLGEGYSSVSIAGGYLFTAGKISNQTTVFCFDLQGKPIWRKANGKAWSTSLSHASSYTGARSTPTFHNGVVYHLGELGRLAAFDTKTGTEKWHRELMIDFGVETTEYGYSESVLIEGDQLYVRPSGKKGYQICLNKNTGDLIWSNTEIPGTEGYSSMILADYGGIHQIVGASSGCYYGVDTNSGRLLWKIDFSNQRELNIADAVLWKEYVLLSSGYGKGSLLSKLNKTGNDFRAEPIWQSELMDNHHGGMILHDGCVFGSGSNLRGWYCLDFLSGKQMWKSVGKGSLTYADGMLYLLDENGTMRLVKATSVKYDQKGEFKVPSGGGGMYWAHPVVCGGTLYIRHADKLYAYDVSSS